jgi:hypothetical protein
MLRSRTFIVLDNHMSHSCVAELCLIYIEGIPPCCSFIVNLSD